jgi:hypothetical protein
MLLLEQWPNCGHNPDKQKRGKPILPVNCQPFFDSSFDLLLIPQLREDSNTKALADQPPDVWFASIASVHMRHIHNPNRGLNGGRAFSPRRTK